MPFLTVKMTPGATKKQKARLIKDLTQVMVDVLGKDPQATRVVIQEISTDDWGVGGETLTARRRNGYLCAGTAGAGKSTWVPTTWLK